MNRLESFLDELQTFQDPETNFVFLGNCIEYDRETVYPQGGSGYLISRYAVSLMAPLLDRFWSLLITQEDFAVGPFLKTFGHTPELYASSTFCGHMFPKKDYERIIAGKIAGIARCPPFRVRWSRQCPSELMPVREIVFYHEYRGNFSQLFHNSERIFNADHTLMWFMQGKWPKVCRTDPAVEISVRVGAAHREKRSRRKN